MKLKKVISGIEGVEVRGSKEIEIGSITASSQRAAPGSLFIAKKGKTHDGSLYSAEAVASGACCIVSDLYNPFLDVVQVIHPHVAAIEAHLADNFFSAPSKELFLVGITGTNGKTTTSYLVRHLLQQISVPCGLIGTVEWIVGENVFPTTRTTPDVVTNQRLLREMCGCGMKACAMEVTSHALDQNRVERLHFSVGVFTNLTQDHLDYHKEMQAYGEAKKKLFTALDAQKGKAVINLDDPFSAAIIAATSAPVLTYGIDRGADLKAEKIRLSASGIDCELVYQEQRVAFHSPLIGRFNLYNCLAAVGVGLSYGASLAACAQALAHFGQVPGRLERVKNRKGIPIFVDYAHTDDALRNVLCTLKEIQKEGKVITVFGCGGDRDKLKRPKMGRVVEELSDVAVVTSDNPRSEEPEQIIREVLAGFQNPQRVYQEVDRAAAIAWAIQQAQKDDLVLIAGKGHENDQVFSHHTIPFDDRKVAQELADR